MAALMSVLAVGGGPCAVPTRCRQVTWPVVTDEDKGAVLEVLADGRLTSMSRAGSAVDALEARWARLVGVARCVAVSNGTSAISLALAAIGIESGDEVLVPALGFIATAVAPLRQLAVPVFVDVDPVTFNMDPARIAERIGPRTRAVLAVHLHGLPAAMEEITAIAGRHDLVVIEDAAQAHGATYQGRATGSLGRIAAFSLNPSKNLPTCGEGGLVTTDDPDLAEQVVMRRQFGEVTPTRGRRTYISPVLGFNDKMSAVQAAFTLSQLTRFAEYHEHRQRNVAALHERLRRLPGIVVPGATDHTTHAWHILRYRFDPTALGYADLAPGRLSQALRRFLVAEGVPLAPYQVVPLPGQEVFRRADGHEPHLVAAGAGRYSMEDYPVSKAVIEDSLTISRVHLPPDAGPRLGHYADAFEKVWEHMDVVVQYARGLAYRPPWAALSEGSGRQVLATGRVG